MIPTWRDLSVFPDRIAGSAAVLSAALAIAWAAYFPALDNGFISDDFVLLERADSWQWSLTPFGAAHETFRLTSYATFWVLKRLGGYAAVWFYLFTISLHAVNGFLLFTLLERLGVRRNAAALAMLLFVCQQNAHEAIMWLSAMNELYLAFFLLLFFHCWIRARYVAAAAMFLCALFSKESALILLLALPWMEYWRSGRLKWRSGYLVLIFPLGIFAVPMLATMDQHLIFSSDDYGFSFSAATVLIHSLHKLLFPWAYLLLAVTLALREPIGFRTFCQSCAWLALPLLPYVFLIYQTHLPSRQFYMSALVLASVVSQWLVRLNRPRFRAFFVALFLVGNIGYIWIRKDAQFELRAAPTHALIRFLESHPPEPVKILDFPYEPWVAKLTTRLVSGWSPDLIVADESVERCPDCMTVRWNRRELEYEIQRD